MSAAFELRNVPERVATFDFYVKQGGRYRGIHNESSIGAARRWLRDCGDEMIGLGRLFVHYRSAENLLPDWRTKRGIEEIKPRAR